MKIELWKWSSIEHPAVSDTRVSSKVQGRAGRVPGRVSWFLARIARVGQGPQDRAS